MGADGRGTVVKLDKVEEPEGLWFCANCFEIFENKNIADCEYCGELNAWDIREDVKCAKDKNFSYYTGCNMCDGKEDKD